MKKILTTLMLLTLTAMQPNAENIQYIEVNEDTTHSNSYNNMLIVDKDNITTMSQADPFLFKDNDTFYLFATSDKYWTSKNLQDWEYKGSFLEEDSHIYDRYWAPEVYKYNDKYLMIYTAVKSINSNLDFRQLQFARTDNLSKLFQNDESIIDIEKSFTENSDKNYQNIDGHIFFEGNNKYLYFKNSKTQGIYVVQLNDDFSISGIPQEIIKVDQQWESYVTEGPYVIKKNNRYYLMYSSGGRYETYAVGYAVADNPMGPFYKITKNSPLLDGHDSKKIINNQNYEVYIGTGHNMVYEDEAGEMYIVYHGYMDDTEIHHRKLMLDYMGIDENGELFVNGTCVDNQPLPSGINGLFYLQNDQYSIKINNTLKNDLSDKVDYNCKTKTVEEENTNNIEICLEKNEKLKNLWLFGTKEGLENTIANIIINDKYIINNVNLGDEPTKEIQLPDIDEKINNIKILPEKEIKLTEIKMYYEKTEQEDIVLTSDKYKIEETIIEKIQPNTNRENLEKNIISNQNYTIKEGDKEVTATDTIKTGQMLIVDDKAYKLVVLGDTNGDGKADIKDILKINKHRLNKTLLTDIYFNAGDINGDGKADIKDILKINKYRLEKLENL